MQTAHPGGPAEVTTPGLDRKDLRTVFDGQVQTMMTSYFFKRAVADDQRRNILILPMLNETSEPLEPQLHALLSKLEVALERDGRMDVVSPANRERLISEWIEDAEGYLDPAQVVPLGQKVGARFIASGRLFQKTVTTPGFEGRRYFFYLQVLDVATGEIRWSAERPIAG